MIVEADERVGGIGFLIAWEGDDCVLHVRGQVDAAGEVLLLEAIQAVLDSECQVVVDLVDVRFTRPTAVESLLDLVSAARARGQSIRLRRHAQVASP